MPGLRSAAAAARCAARARPLAIPDPLVLAAGGALALGTVLRIVAGADLPLWLDETFTGALAAEETFSQLIQQSLLEPNGPLYFVMMHFWSQLFGLSNGALRFPSLVFGIAAPLVTLIPIEGVSRKARFIWCIFIALWIPGIWYSQEARCYSLLLCLAMGATVAYARLLAMPNMRRAIIWTCLGSLAILTHYHALLLIGLQGIAYLVIHRTRAIRTWPAALAFLPPFAWIWLQLPRIEQFADPSSAWFELLTLADFFDIVDFTVGEVGLATPLALIAAFALIVGLQRNPAPSGVEVSDNSSAYAWVVVGTAALAAVVVFAVGMLRPSFTPRYLMSFVPGMMLGLALITVALGRRWALAPAACALIFVASAVTWAIKGNWHGIKYYSFEAASDALMRSGAERVVFLLDSPMTRVYDPSQLQSAGGFFFRRERASVLIEPIYLRPGEDPNTRLLDAASSPGSAILWIYDVNVRATAATAHPPRIEQIDREWHCRNFGRLWYGVIACDRRARPLN